MSTSISKAITGFMAALIVATMATTAQAQNIASLPPLTAPATATGEAKPIYAWVDFCRRYASECAVDTREADTITVTPKVWQLITAVNRKVNTDIKPMTDQDHWGVADQWDIPTDGYGDCEDYQLLKRKLLAEAGLPRRAMRMTVVVDERGDGHAVLMLRTDRGDYILDNKTSQVMSWYATGYVYVKRESQSVVGWVSLGGAVSPTATATR